MNFPKTWLSHVTKKQSMKNSNSTWWFCHWCSLSARVISEFLFQATGKLQTLRVDLSVKLIILFPKNHLCTCLGGLCLTTLRCFWKCPEQICTAEPGHSPCGVMEDSDAHPFSSITWSGHCRRCSGTSYNHTFSCGPFLPIAGQLLLELCYNKLFRKTSCMQQYSHWSLSSWPFKKMLEYNPCPVTTINTDKTKKWHTVTRLWGWLFNL